MKQYVLTLSKVYHKKHRRAGEPTNFRELIEKDLKKHTIRENYDFWAARFRNIAKGEAVLSIRQWSGLPYRSKQELICNLGKDDGIGLDCLWRSSTNPHLFNATHVKRNIHLDELAINDGLDIEDFRAWFKNIPCLQANALIYLGDFRYK